MAKVNHQKKLLKEFGEHLQSMAELIAGVADRTLPGWTELFYDVRFAGDFSVTRTILRKGKKRVSVGLPTSVSAYRERIWALRKKMKAGQWYGLMLRMTASGEVLVTYNYDKHCLETIEDDDLARRPF